MTYNFYQTVRRRLATDGEITFPSVRLAQAFASKIPLPRNKSWLISTSQIDGNPETTTKLSISSVQEAPNNYRNRNLT